MANGNNKIKSDQTEAARRQRKDLQRVANAARVPKGGPVPGLPRQPGSKGSARAA